MTPIYIAHEDGSFREHSLDETGSVPGDSTECGIKWSDLPDIVGSDGTTWIDDKPWYADHDRDGVIRCEVCQRISD